VTASWVLIPPGVRTQRPFISSFVSCGAMTGFIGPDPVLFLPDALRLVTRPGKKCTSIIG